MPQWALGPADAVVPSQLEQRGVPKRARTDGSAQSQPVASTQNDHKISIKDKGLREMLKLMTKQTLQVKQMADQHHAILYDFYRVPSDGKLATALQAASQQYTEKTQAAGRGHELGGPVPYMYLALIQHLITEEINPIIRTTLTNHVKTLEQSQLVDIYQICKHCQIQKMYKSEFKRLALSFVSTENPLIVADAGADASEPAPIRLIVNAIRTALLQIGAQKQNGKAPAGAMERELAVWLKALDS